MFTLYVDYRGDELRFIKIKEKSFVNAGRKAEEIISEKFWNQELRELIYCFTLEDSEGNVAGRFRPHRHCGSITFGFYFE